MTRIFEYIPVLTSIMALIFTIEMSIHYRRNQVPHLFWWTTGLAFYCLGTMSESINILFGWNEMNFRFWYIIGAVWGGFPLAQGMVYLFMPRKFSDFSTSFWIVYNAIAMFFIIKSPIAIDPEIVERMSGEMFEWQWVRYFSPFINIYSAAFLVVWAAYSANQYFYQINREAKFMASLSVFFGSMLTVIGGIYAKIGYTNVLYITEFIGLIFIYRGIRSVRDQQ